MTGPFRPQHKIFLVVILMIYAIAQVFSGQVKSKPHLNVFEKVLVSITAPPQEFLSFVMDKSHGAWTHYIHLIHTQKHYQRIFKKNRHVQVDLSQLEELKKENRRLRSLLDFRDTVFLKMVPARVISFGNSSFTHSVRIDKGKKNGIEAAMAVVTPDGVVGHVTQVTDFYANVLLILDPNSNVDVRLQSTRDRGILVGQGKSPLKLDFFITDVDDLIGDILITSGLDSVFPKGLTVGTVSEKKPDPRSLFAEVLVQPAVNFSRLEEVFVVTSKTRMQDIIQ